MANADHLELINQGAGPWNAWREQYPDLIPDLESSAFALGEKQWGPEYGGPINLTKARMRNSDLRYATLIGSVMEGADLAGARFFNARLAGANLRNADLSDARFDDADVKNAEFDGAILYGADLSTAKNLTTDQVDSAQVDDTTLLPANVVKAFKKRAQAPIETEAPEPFEVQTTPPPLPDPEPEEWIKAIEEAPPPEPEPEPVQPEPDPEPEPVMQEPDPEPEPVEPEPEPSLPAEAKQETPEEPEELPATSESKVETAPSPEPEPVEAEAGRAKAAEATTEPPEEPEKTPAVHAESETDTPEAPRPVPVSLVVAQSETPGKAEKTPAEPEKSKPEPEPIEPGSERPIKTKQEAPSKAEETPKKPAESEREAPPQEPKTAGTAKLELPSRPESKPDSPAEAHREMPREPDKEPLRLAEIAKLELPVQADAKDGEPAKTQEAPPRETETEPAKRAEIAHAGPKRPGPAEPISEGTGEAIGDVPRFLRREPAARPEIAEPEAEASESVEVKPPKPRRSALSRFRRPRVKPVRIRAKRRAPYVLPVALTLLACVSFGFAFWVSDWRPTADNKDAEPANTLAEIEPEAAPDAAVQVQPDVPLPERPGTRLARETNETIIAPRQAIAPPEAAPVEPPEAVAATAPEALAVEPPEPLVITPPGASTSDQPAPGDTLQPGDLAAIPPEPEPQDRPESLPDDDAWSQAVALGTREALQDYLDDHPNGAHVPEAETRLENLILAAAEAEIARLLATDSAAWTAALEAGTREALQVYLTENPGGRHAEEAQKRLAAFGSRAMDRPVPERAPAKPPDQAPNAASMTAPGGDQADRRP